MKSTLRSTKLCFTIQQEEQKALKQIKAKKKKQTKGHTTSITLKNDIVLKRVVFLWIKFKKNTITKRMNDLWQK